MGWAQFWKGVIRDVLAIISFFLGGSIDMVHLCLFVDSVKVQLISFFILTSYKVFMKICLQGRVTTSEVLQLNSASSISSPQLFIPLFSISLPPEVILDAANP